MRVVYSKAFGTSPPGPSKRAVKLLRKMFSSLVAICDQKAHPVSLEVALAHTPSDKRKPVYVPAFVSLLQFPIFYFKEDGQILVFVKEEKNVLEGEEHVSGEPLVEASTWVNDPLRNLDPLLIETPKDPRVISPFCPRFNLTWMRFIVPVESLIYELIDKRFNMYRSRYGREPSKTVAKGLNADAQAEQLLTKWNGFRRPRGLVFDITRFDGHTVEDLVSCVHGLYRKLLVLNKDLAALFLTLCRVITHPSVESAKSVRGGSIKYLKKICRLWSGIPDTSLLAIVLVCCIALIWCESSGIFMDIFDCGDDHEGFVEDEDLAVVLDSRSGYQKHFRDFGFHLKVEEVVEDFEKLRFCSAVPVEVEDGYWRMTRLPASALAKDLFFFRPFHQTEQRPMLLRRHAAAVAACGLALYSAYPVFGAFYRWLKRFSRDAKPLRLGSWEALAILSKGIRKMGETPTSRSRSSFALAFGIQPSAQIALEIYFDKLPIDVGNPGPRSHLDLVLRS